MNIILYQNLSDPREYPKKLTTLATKTGTLKEATNIVNPTLIISDFDTRANYCYVEEFERYYYINQPNVIRTGLYEVTCKGDPLMSFLEEVKLAPLTMERSPQNFDSYIPDKSRAFYQYTSNQYLKFPQGNIGRPNTPILVTVG